MSIDQDVPYVMEQLKNRITNPNLSENQKWLLAADEVRMIGVICGTHNIGIREAWEMIEKYERENPSTLMEEPHPKKDIEETVFWEYMNEWEHYDELTRKS